MIFEKVRDILVEELGIDESEVNLESTLQGDLGADSLDIVEIVMALEEEFDIEVPDEDTANIKTVNNVVEYIKSKQ